MKIVVTATGKQGSGKTRALKAIEACLRAHPMSEETEVRFYEGDGRTFSENAPIFTVAASPSGRTERRESGDRETIDIAKREDGFWYVTGRGQCLAACGTKEDASMVARYMRATPYQKEAISAVLHGRTFGFDGTRAHFPEPGEENWKGGGGEIEDPAGVISQGRLFTREDQRTARYLYHELGDILARPSHPLLGHQKVSVRKASRIVKHISCGVGVGAANGPEETQLDRMTP